ncbi:MAG: cytochrome c [Gammaproteobacteria bacterium]|nr:cytochrome c [Gammaproteobacteria bacterium]
MSTLPEPKPPAQQPSAAARYLFVLLLGLAVGVFATVMVVRALQARTAHFPSSVMHVKQWHMGQLRQRAEENRCNATDVLPHLRALRTMAEDLEPAFPRLSDDRRFAQAASGMRAALDDALASPPINCAGLGTTNKRVRDSCRACHQDFRS